MGSSPLTRPPRLSELTRSAPLLRPPRRSLAPPQRPQRLPRRLPRPQQLPLCRRPQGEGQGQGRASFSRASTCYAAPQQARVAAARCRALARPWRGRRSSACGRRRAVRQASHKPIACSPRAARTRHASRRRTRGGRWSPCLRLRPSRSGAPPPSRRRRRRPAARQPAGCSSVLCCASCRVCASSPSPLRAGRRAQAARRAPPAPAAAV
mmetsp:Transcript_46183/g.146686  ORF Transcript_46183/g.146686 Transcript_46183/m.146686 type:complete len:209 (-) Transcript_46183:104-730(-)